jgi:predicted S18 family serine protease
LAVLLIVLMASGAAAREPAVLPAEQEQLIWILGTTLDSNSEPTGVVSALLVSLGKRSDHNGLAVTFQTVPGRFSALAQIAVTDAILRTAKLAGLPYDSWTVVLTVPYQGVTVYGASLSAMVGLTVVALAKGDPVPGDRVITGTVTDKGEIGPVGGVPLKVNAAYESHLHRVLVPEEQDVADSDWRTPFLMQVSPVRSVSQAYQALIGQPLRDDPVPLYEAS